MREQADAPSKEGAQPIGFAQGQELQDVHARHEVLDVVEVAQGETLEERTLELQRPERMRRRRESVCERHRPVREPRSDGCFLSSGGNADRSSRSQIDRYQRICARRQSERRAGTRELDDECPIVERRDAPDSQLWIETVGEIVPGSPAKSRC